MKFKFLSGVMDVQLAVDANRNFRGFLCVLWCINGVFLSHTLRSWDKLWIHLCVHSDQDEDK